MSYSFTVRGATKAEAIKKIGAELRKVVTTQPFHAADRAQARAAAKAFIGVLPDAADGQEFCVSVSGSVGWVGTLGEADNMLTSAGISVSAVLVTKEA